MNLDNWMKEGRYLPRFMRDFHDQKDIFKAVHGIITVENHEYAKDVSWVAGQCYVIDIFLWFMARRGYTLQRSKTKLPFRDLQEDVQAYRNSSRAAMAAALSSNNPRSADGILKP